MDASIQAPLPLHGLINEGTKSRGKAFVLCNYYDSLRTGSHSFSVAHWMCIAEEEESAGKLVLY